MMGVKRYKLPGALLFAPCCNFTLIAAVLLLQYPTAGSDQQMSVKRGSQAGPGQAATEIMSEPQVLKLELGDTARFPCQVSNLGPVVLIWKHGTRVLTAGVGAVAMHVKRDDRVSLVGTDLVIVNVTQSDAGTYTCELDTDDVTPLAVSHTLQILVAPSLTRHPVSGELVVKKGSTVSLKCQASGSPIPEISWSKKNGLLDSGDKFIVGGVYTMRNISQYQSGVYICQASNGVGYPVVQHINLTVLYSPEVRAELPVVHSGLGYGVSLSCIVNSNPPANVRWYRHSLLLENDNNFLIESRGSLQTLIIRKVAEDNFGGYKCSAGNSLGRETADIQLTGLPRAPVFQSGILSKMSNSHILSWATESYSTIVEYRLVYRKHQESKGNDILYVWTHLNLRGDNSNNNIIQNMTYDLDNLEEDSKYEAKVEARNVWGWSNQSDVFKFFTRTKETPKQLPIEPEKTPAPSKSGDFQHFSMATVSRPGWFPSYISVFVIAMLAFLSRHNIQ